MGGAELWRDLLRPEEADDEVESVLGWIERGIEVIYTLWVKQRRLMLHKHSRKLCVKCCVYVFFQHMSPNLATKCHESCLIGF